MKKHISSGAIIYRKNGEKMEILIMHRETTNSWHLPKGTQEENETLDQTALREVKEETGLDIDLGVYIGKIDSTFERSGDFINKETHYFIGTPLSGDIKNHDKEHETIVFVDYLTALYRLENFSLYEDEGKILKMAEKHFA